MATPEEIAVQEAADKTAAEAAAKGGAAAASAAAGTSPDWKSTATPETQKLIEIKGWKTPEDVIKGYSELERLVGQDKIPAPRKDKDGNFEKGELERYLGAVGAPKDIKGYVMPKEAVLEEATGFKAEQLDPFKAMALKYNLLPHQYQGIMKEITGLLNTGAKQKADTETKTYDESVAALKTELGEVYDQKVALSNRVLRNFVTADRADSIVKKFGNDPDLIKLLANIGENLSEDKLSGEGMGGALLTPDQAEAEIKAIKADPKHPYFVATHPDHAWWVTKMEQLYKMAESGKKK